MQDFFRVVQITDTHLYADTSKRLLGINTHDSFMAVIDSIREQPWQANLLLLTGDLSQDESVPAYQRLAQKITTLKAPTYWLPGNHDSFQDMLAHLTGPTLHHDKNIIKDNWQIILLNSQIPGKVPGLLAHTELQFLKMCLMRYPLHHALICFHHPAVAVGCGWLDPLGLQNPAELFAIVEQYPQVKAILNGHIHQQFDGHYKNIAIYTTPSTCIQFKPNVRQFALDIVPPGYRYLKLHKDGSIKTQVLRADKFADYTQADPLSRGY